MSVGFRVSAALALAATVVLGLGAASTGSTTTASAASSSPASVRTASEFRTVPAGSTSAPLRQMARRVAASGVTAETTRDVTTRRPNPRSRRDAQLATSPQPVEITNDIGSGPVDAPGASAGFDVITNPSDGYYPPDPDSDVSETQVVTVANAMIAIHNKKGTALQPQVALNTVWDDFGGDCETHNDGDPIVQYDRQAKRWLVSQFAVNEGAPSFECVAISKTSDAMGEYYRYAFEYEDFPDFPKIGVWPDGYYITYNMFDSVTSDFVGSTACAWDRSAMLAGGTAREVCFDNAYPGADPAWSLLPSDLDGSTLPPDDSPNYLIGEHWADVDKLTMYRFAVDWDSPASSTFTGPFNMPVKTFFWGCFYQDRGRCVPQPDTSVQLESLGSRAMFRLAYRNYGDHESLVLNHTVDLDGDGPNTRTGIGWFEIRDPSAASPKVHQDGVIADADGQSYRFMGSMAMDRQGNTALGYSTASATKYPSIGYVGRSHNDPLDTMPMGETVLKAGTGSQTGSAGRWGDYNSMEVDPVDDCTFWYTNQYVKTTGPKAWITHVSSFVFPSCQVPGAPTDVVATVKGGKSVEVSWTKPEYAGSNAITGYTATATPGDVTCEATVADDSCTFDDLAPNRTYAITVVAENSYGLGAKSAEVPASTVKGSQTITVPPPPTNLRVGMELTPFARGGESGNPVTVSVASQSAAVCVGSQARVDFLAQGTCTLLYSQAGNDDFDAAADVTQDLVIGARLQQQPVASLKLPSKLNDKGTTKVVKLPVTTNAGQSARVTITLKPEGKKGLSSDGYRTVKLTGRKATKVTVSITAPEAPGYTSYSLTKMYKTKRAR